MTVDALVGPEGPLDPGRLRIGLPEHSDDLQPLLGMVVVATGHGPRPVTGLELVLDVQPTWQDAPGLYRGMLVLTPLAGGEPFRGGAPKPANGPRLQPRSIPIEMEIAELTVVVTPTEGFDFETDAGEGRFTMIPDIELFAASNAERWNVELVGQPLTQVGGDHIIPLVRARWAEMDPDGRPGLWTSLETSNALVQRFERGTYHGKFRVIVDINMSDPAGDYRSSLELVATGGGS